MTVRAYAPASLGGFVTRVPSTAAQAANTVAQGQRDQHQDREAAHQGIDGDAAKALERTEPDHHLAQRQQGEGEITTYFSSSRTRKKIASSVSKITSTIGATPAAAYPALAPPAALRPNVWPARR